MPLPFFSRELIDKHLREYWERKQKRLSEEALIERAITRARVGRKISKALRNRPVLNTITCFCMTCPTCKNRIKNREWRKRKRFDLTPLLSK